MPNVEQLQRAVSDARAKQVLHRSVAHKLLGACGCSSCKMKPEVEPDCQTCRNLADGVDEAIANLSRSLARFTDSGGLRRVK
jgi:hypothetical protein